MTGVRGYSRSGIGPRMTQFSLELPHKLVVPGVVHGQLREFVAAPRS